MLKTQICVTRPPQCVKLGPNNSSRLKPLNSNGLQARKYLALPETRSADAVNTKWHHTKAIRVPCDQSRTTVAMFDIYALGPVLIMSYGAIQMRVVA